MANNNNNNSTMPLRSILEKDKLTRTKFLEWFRNLRIVFKQERKLYVLDEPLLEEAAENVPRAEKNAYEKHHNDSIDVACLMLATMSSKHQKDLENMEAYDMIFNLKEMFQQQARQERYETTKGLHSFKMAEGTSVSAHVLKMKGYIEHLDRLGFPLSQELATNLILNSLPDSYGQFVMNYNMNEMDKSISELHIILKTSEQNIKSKPSHVLMVQNGKGFKGKGKGKGKGKSNAQPKPKPQPKAKAPKEGVCFFQNEAGHWKRNYKLYLEDLKKKKKTGETSSSSIYVIQINFSPSSSWVLDTGCGSHICTNVQGLKRSRQLKKGEVDLRVGNGSKVAALVVGSYELTFPSGLLLVSDNCYYVPTICRNIISVSCLDNDGFSFIIKNNNCSIFHTDMFYANAYLQDGLYVMNLQKFNNSHVYNITTKKFKSNDLNSTYLWNCRLGHINEKRISKLHQVGLLNSFDFESYDTCESCLLGKMTKDPFTGNIEMANELLDLIHAYVCGPLSSDARRGYKYFITFTYDFSRYGYVYLMRHKSESFEMFKSFQNEVQNQLGKTIKALRSYRGVEYLSQ